MPFDIKPFAVVHLDGTRDELEPGAVYEPAPGMNGVCGHYRLILDEVHAQRLFAVLGVQLPGIDGVYVQIAPCTFGQGISGYGYAGELAPGHILSHDDHEIVLTALRRFALQNAWRGTFHGVQLSAALDDWLQTFAPDARFEQEREAVADWILGLDAEMDEQEARAERTAKRKSRKAAA